MAPASCGQCVRWAAWWIRRNPMYLLSAGCIAVGARLYLVAPSARAGDVGLILLTLGVLQAYELAVAGVLLCLHRRRRSPEDEPSLLLVTALFWTGPMAATAEMTAHRPHLGLILAVGACLIALAELRAVRRVMGFRISGAGRAAACACVILLAIAPPLLRVPDEVNGTNEVFLYFAWWLLAGVVMMSMGSVRFHAPGRRYSASPVRAWKDFHVEIALVAIAVAATAAHLVGMNYAFFGHAELFYASPLLVAVAVVAMDYIARTASRSRWLLAACASLPGIAVVLAARPFDEHMPVKMLPVWLRDPMLMALAMAAVVWWCGYAWHAWTPLLHAGSASLAFALFRAVSTRPPSAISFAAVPITGESSRDLIVLGLYAIAGYLLLVALLRRSTSEALAALAVNQAAVTVWVWERTQAEHADLMIICLVAGWSWLVGLHLAARRPNPLVAFWPIAFLVTITWMFELQPALECPARIHAGVIVVVLLILGQLWPWTRYRLMAAGAGGCNVVFFTARWVMGGSHPAPAAAVLTGFLLLAAGAVISWYKPALLGMTGFAEPAETPRPPGSKQA